PNRLAPVVAHMSRRCRVINPEVILTHVLAFDSCERIRLRFVGKDGPLGSREPGASGLAVHCNRTANCAIGGAFAVLAFGAGLAKILEIFSTDVVAEK